MSSNAILNKAKYSENTDEWYTSYDTVASEVLHYFDQFKNKVVLCNCDDPLKSAFSLFFLRNFNKLELKQLICTSYVGSRILEEGKLIDNESHKLLSKYAYVMSIEKMPPSDSINDDKKLINYLRTSKCINKLHGDGDFRSEECLEYLKISDIVVTNPPFSKFIELFSLLIKYNKKFLLIGNQNALTYKEIFPYIKNGTVWIGYHFGEMSFKVPADTVPRKYRFWIDETGQKWRSLGNAMWLTNLDTERKHQELSLNSIYEPSRYPHYDNEFLPIGFNIVHKQRALEKYSDELLEYLDENKTHKFYWEKPIRKKEKPFHPMENDISLPLEIRGKHYESWTELAKDLGYGE